MNLCLLCVAFPASIPCWFLQVQIWLRGLCYPKNVHTTLQDPSLQVGNIINLSSFFLANFSFFLHFLATSYLFIAWEKDWYGLPPTCEFGLRSTFISSSQGHSPKLGRGVSEPCLLLLLLTSSLACFSLSSLSFFPGYLLKFNNYLHFGRGIPQIVRLGF
jgi:hypothetical protein